MLSCVCGECKRCKKRESDKRYWDKQRAVGRRMSMDERKKLMRAEMRIKKQVEAGSLDGWDALMVMIILPDVLEKIEA